MLEDLTKEEKRQKTRELKKGLDTDIHIITMVDNMIVMYSYIYFEVIRHFFKGGEVLQLSRNPSLLAFVFTLNQW